jgi:hypothetical protein
MNLNRVSFIGGLDISNQKGALPSKSLDGSKSNKHIHILRSTRYDGTHKERNDSKQEDGFATKDVSKSTIQRHSDGAG